MFRNLALLSKSAFAGESLFRAHQTRFLSQLQIHGEVLDLGSKSRDSKHLRPIDMSQVTSLTLTDFNPEDDTVLRVDLRESLPFESASFDFVLAMNLFEHLENPNHTIGQAFSVLRPGGSLVGVVPFLYPFHPDPDDFLRPTETLLRSWFTGCGYREFEVFPLGVGAWTVSSHMRTQFYLFRSLRLLSWVRSQLIDELLQRVKRNGFDAKSQNYFLGYAFVARK